MRASLSVPLPNADISGILSAASLSRCLLGLAPKRKKLLKSLKFLKKYELKVDFRVVNWEGVK